ncbi:hypothetical protein SCHPADRAFT_440969 [Schizopora paradoxa]|uniref:DUF6534 domain-containing protein n=1 Tax=Schizopora paradoxa TaxID=27342 RepID=A0A0H2RJM9_9AGAM|nr:hypothetical protein SCHPADRAFT_440969 [Schizopora paradoxa]
MTSFNDTAGSILVGAFVTVLFFGASTTQAVNYFQNYRSDGWFIILIVVFTLCLDTLHVLFVTHGTFKYFLKNVGDTGKLLVVPWSFASVILVTCSNVAVVRIFFVRRTWYLSDKNYIVTAIQTALSAGSFAVAICAGVRVLSLKTFMEVAETPWVIYATLATDMIADIFIAGTSSYYLFRTSSGYKRTSNLLNTLALYVVGTGVITVLWDVSELVLYAALHDTLLFSVFYLSLSKLYTNALLASLNARPVMQRKQASYYVAPPSEGQKPPTVSDRVPHFLSDVVDSATSSFQTSRIVTLELGPDITSSESATLEPSQSSEKFTKL